METNAVLDTQNEVQSSLLSSFENRNIFAFFVFPSVQFVSILLNGIPCLLFSAAEIQSWQTQYSMAI